MVGADVKSQLTLTFQHFTNVAIDPSRPLRYLSAGPISDWRVEITIKEKIWKEQVNKYYLIETHRVKTMPARNETACFLTSVVIKHSS
jgi:hypothetical protein